MRKGLPSKVLTQDMSAKLKRRRMPSPQAVPITWSDGENLQVTQFPFASFLEGSGFT